MICKFVIVNQIHMVKLKKYEIAKQPTKTKSQCNVRNLVICKEIGIQLTMII
jgi:hypothetical protein